jgi:hypothetical protein
MGIEKYGLKGATDTQKVRSSYGFVQEKPF